jgi:hypothetical protein
MARSLAPSRMNPQEPDGTASSGHIALQRPLEPTETHMIDLARERVLAFLVSV